LPVHETVLAIKKLIEQQVLAIIGPNQTGTTLAVIPLRHTATCGPRSPRT
jgi:hypothetical protein